MKVKHAFDSNQRTNEHSARLRMIDVKYCSDKRISSKLDRAQGAWEIPALPVGPSSKPGSGDSHVTKNATERRRPKPRALDVHHRLYGLLRGVDDLRHHRRAD